jgi:hypothetical protein
MITSDHFMTAKAVLDAAEGLTGTRRLHYVGYASAKLPENLSPQDRDMKCAIYAVTLAGVLALDHPAAWQHYNHSSAGRRSARTSHMIRMMRSLNQNHITITNVG